MEFQQATAVPARVLVVEDDRAIRNLLSELLVGEGYDVETAADADQALAVLPHWRPDVILLDMALPGVDIWAFRAAQSVLDQARDIPTVVLSTVAPLSADPTAASPSAILPRPFDIGALLATVQRLTHRGWLEDRYTTAMHS